jgi:hypothetical protein
MKLVESNHNDYFTFCGLLIWNYKYLKEMLLIANTWLLFTENSCLFLFGCFSIFSCFNRPILSGLYCSFFAFIFYLAAPLYFRSGFPILIKSLTNPQTSYAPQRRAISDTFRNGWSCTVDSS